MKLAIMQPYIFPYIGYFQLMNAADEFIVYDKIEFTKKGWINRNRILVNGKDDYISFPVKKDSDFLNISDRYLADGWEQDRKKILNKITESYRRAPHFNNVYPLIEKALLFEDKNLFSFILNSLQLVKEYLEIQTQLIVSSAVLPESNLKGENKVIEICKTRNARIYINPIGGTLLYSKERFEEEGINLQFLRSTNVPYRQFNDEYVPWLSIIDVMMFNFKEDIRKLMKEYILE
jgi:hypothetical protein